MDRSNGASPEEAPSLSPQQARFQGGKGPLSAYRALAVGEQASLLYLLGYECYTLLAAPLPGLLGFAGRALLVRSLLKSCGHAPRIGKSVTIRQPRRIRFGENVLVDDYAVLDVRTTGPGSSAEIELGDYALIGRGTIIAAKEGTIRLGRAVNISSGCRIATETSVTIGESTLIAAYAYIGPGNHRRDDEGRPQIDAGMELKGGVSIGAHCWIGARATILDGVTIGDNAIVGAHSFVREDVPAGAVVAGTPARRLA